MLMQHGWHAQQHEGSQLPGPEKLKLAQPVWHASSKHAMPSSAAARMLYPSLLRMAAPAGCFPGFCQDTNDQIGAMLSNSHDG
jgi:hypothetical protein